MISNSNCIKELLKQSVHNYIFLVLNTFHHIQAAFYATSSKHNSNKSFKLPTHPPFESQISSFNDSKNNKVHFTKINSRFQAREKIHIIESDDENRTKSAILERTIYLEMNKTEFLREGSE